MCGPDGSSSDGFLWKANREGERKERKEKRNEGDKEKETWGEGELRIESVERGLRKIEGEEGEKNGITAISNLFVCSFFLKIKLGQEFNLLFGPSQVGTMASLIIIIFLNIFCVERVF